MNYQNSIITQIEQNKEVFDALLNAVPVKMQLFKENPQSWCLLEIICHLLDEEIYDFRARVKHALERPNTPLKPISPKTWPVEHDYLGKNYKSVLKQFLIERTNSITWLRSLDNISWNNEISHPDLGMLSAKVFLENWLAHDYLHIRQINHLKRSYLNMESKDDLTYAGKW